MPNIFLIIAWPLIISLTKAAYRISNKKFKHDTAILITGITGFVSALVIGNIIGYLYSGFEPKIETILFNLLFVISPFLPA